MTCFSLTRMLLPIMLAAVIHAIDTDPIDVSQCERRARQEGRPLDGWKVVQYADGKRCRRETVDLMCYGDQYYDPITREASCCDPPKVITWASHDRKLGYCCPDGHRYSSDSTTGRGGCCLVGMNFVGGRCQESFVSPATHPVVPPIVPVEQRPMGCVNMCGSPSNGPCGSTPVCANQLDLGIKYGHCYILSFPDGDQLGAQRDDLTYAKGGYFQDIPFKVCKSTIDCTYGSSVPHGGVFYLQDQNGRHNDLYGKPGWISNAADGAHMAFIDDSLRNLAGQFKGTAACANGQCAIKLMGGPTGQGGVAAAGPMDAPGITFWPNKKIGIKLHFTETRCDGLAAFAPSLMDQTLH